MLVGHPLLLTGSIVRLFVKQCFFLLCEKR
jgi:hypothetical protein